MTTADAHAPAVSIRERYRDVVSDRWPVTVAPQADELVSSWLHRLAYANGVPRKPSFVCSGLIRECGRQPLI